MERWQIELDKYLTEPPEDKYEDVEVGECDHCKTALLHGETVYYDSREGHNFCDVQCFKNYIKDHISSEVDYYVELLEENKDTYSSTIEADFDDEQPEEDYREEWE